jgi:inosine/guanosine/xanthosine phosphorylase family protein
MQQAFEYLQNILKDNKPDVGVILGSGLGGLVEVLKNPIKISYADIPEFPVPTVKGHQGYLYVGKIGSHTVMCLQGRVHLYEGHSPQLIYSFIEMLKDLGVKTLIVTNAAGSLYRGMPAGSLMLITDHINLSGKNPLIGPHKEPYFPDMSHAYNATLRRQIKEVALENNIDLYEGIYLMTLGPNFETPSEIKMFKFLGANAVGMSTVAEVISAVHAGLDVIGVSVISNLGTGLSEGEQSHDDVLAKVGAAGKKLGVLIQKFLEKY